MVDLTQYQHHVTATQPPGQGTTSIALPACRLTAAAGAVASAVAHGEYGLLAQRHYRLLLTERLGDLFVTAAVLASAADLELADVVTHSLTTLDDFHSPDQPNLSALPLFDSGYPEQQRLPRQMTVVFRAHRNPRGQHVATANWYEPQPTTTTTRHDVAPQSLGDPLTDNARHPDGYRFHDAIHLGFLAVLGWSPNLRALLRRKRKSDPLVDECEDGARAVFAEEGLAAILARLATTHHGFRTCDTVTRETVDLARAATTGLEVNAVPGWLWRRAICHGFTAMNQLITHDGGVLTTDLDTRTLTYRPPPTGQPEPTL
jgi:hypothetical protein